MEIVLRIVSCWIIVWSLTLTIFPTQQCLAGPAVAFERRSWPAGLLTQGYYSSRAWSGAVDLKQDLGVRDTALLSNRITLAWDGCNRLSYDAFDGQYAGQAARTERVYFTVRIWGVNIRTSRLMTHQLTENIYLSYRKIGWNHDFWQAKVGRVKLGYILDVKTISGQATATVRSTLSNSAPVVQTGITTWKLTAPTIGMSLDVEPTAWLKFHTEISGLKAGNWSFYDRDTNLTVYLDKHKHAGLTIGFRAIDYRNAKQPVSTQLNHFRLAGKYYGFMVRF